MFDFDLGVAYPQMALRQSVEDRLLVLDDRQIPRFRPRKRYEGNAVEGAALLESVPPAAGVRVRQLVFRLLINSSTPGYDRGRPRLSGANRPWLARIVRTCRSSCTCRRPS